MFANKNYLIFIFLLRLLDLVASKKQVYKVNDETGKNAYLGNVAQDFGLPALSRTDPPRQYSVVSGENYLKVNNRTGDLHTVALLDRERLCPQNPRKCKVDAEIFVSPKIYFQVLKIQLQIDDLNDNIPSFPNNPIRKDISESAKVGTVMRLDSATDPDLGKNSIKRYKIASVPPGSQNRNGTSVPYFTLFVLDNIDGTKIPELRLTQELDRETVSSYSLLLYAIDGGSPPQTGTATVSITVTDANDNQPFFLKSNYVVKVKENVPPGFVVTQVQATDKDSGRNAKIEYGFSSIVSDQDLAIFSLNSSTGVLSIKGVGLDFENKTIHHLTVEAKDGGPNSASAYATITVKVQDVNDEHPHININFIDVENNNNQKSDGSDLKPILIKENLDSGTFLAFVTVTDRDTGSNGKIGCKLMDTSSFELKTLDKNDNRYYIETKGVLDREVNRLHNVEVVAWDYGRPSLNSSKSVLVELLDENDNDPSFAKSVYHLSVSENVKPGDEIVVLTADDQDFGLNAQITYSAVPYNKSETVPFAINPKNGAVYYLRNAPNLDAEAFSGPFKMIVTATDNGTPPRRTNTTLVITITDENDNTPKFEQSDYVFRILENSKHGQFVGTVKAHDNDVDNETNGRITYGFESDSVPFSIKPSTGEISFIGDAIDIDRESRQAQPYVLTVTATDHGFKPLVDHCIVEIYLIDVNDNLPHIVFPNVTKDIFYLYISEQKKKRSLSGDKEKNATFLQENPLRNSLLIGSAGIKNLRSPNHLPVVITTIEANDPDEGENGRTRFILSAGNRRKYFAVDSQSGKVLLNVDSSKALRKMERGCHVIKVDVKDLGKPIKQSATWVNVYITDKKPGTLNATLVMRQCMNSTFYPVQFLPVSDPSSSLQFELWLIIVIAIAGFVVLLVFMIVVIAVRKKRNRNESRTYSCKNKPDKFGNTKHSPGLSMQLMKNKDIPEKLANGTVDSRQSFAIYTEAAAQEKDPMLLQQDNTAESIRSHGSARDSGTGDSMPSDAYHNAANQRQVPILHSYPMHQSEFGSSQPNNTQLYYQQPEDHSNPDKHGHSSHPRNCSKCTEECRLHGHSDMCWMPESSQRSSSRMASVQEFETGSLRNRSRTPSIFPNSAENMRYPPTSGHYYDPANRFETNHSHPPMGSFREDYVESDAGSGRYPRMMSSEAIFDPSSQQYFRGYPSHEQIVHTPYSQAPVQYTGQTAMSYPVQVPTSHLNMHGGGYEVDRGIPNEIPSYISGNGSGMLYPSYELQGDPNQSQYPQMQNYPSEYATNYPQDGYAVSSNAYIDPAQGYVPSYEEDFSASSLLLSPAYTEPSTAVSYGQERQIPYQSMGRPTDTMDSKFGQKTNSNASSSEHENVDGPNEKLDTIKEIDADEVVAQIDELLL